MFSAHQLTLYKRLGPCCYGFYADPILLWTGTLPADSKIFVRADNKGKFGRQYIKRAGIHVFYTCLKKYLLVPG